MKSFLEFNHVVVLSYSVLTVNGTLDSENEMNSMKSCRCQEVWMKL